MDSVVPPGLTLIELGSSTIDTRGIADAGGPVCPAGPASVASQPTVARHTIARLATLDLPMARIRR
jgi:hypothetical protein